MQTLEPSRVDEIAEILASASREGKSVLTLGGATKIDWGPAPKPVDLILSTTRLNAVLAHRHGDLTATVQAGITLAAANRELAQHGQWIPLDPPWADRATIGGIVSTNDSGPRRHRYGAPRDLIIGIEIVRADGRIAKGGGIVVKNVAGYDLPRLITGSFGSLAVVAGVTFKLFPLAPASRTVVVHVDATDTLASIVSGFLSSQLTPTALELETPPLRVLVRFETIEASLNQQTRDAVSLAGSCGGTARIVDGAEEQDVWERHAARPWAAEGCVLKVSALATDVAPVLEWLRESAGPLDYEATGRAGLGVLLVRVGGDASDQAAIVMALRDKLPAGRASAVVLRGSPELKQMIDVWGPIGDGFELMRAVKREFDPAGILNPGRGPGGL